MAIHPTAAVHPGAVIGKNVEIGPYAVVENNCTIGDNCWIDAHAKVCEFTTVGENTRIYYGALVGTEPQDHRFKPGLRSYTIIGKDAVIREYVTIHRSPFAEQITSVGDGTLLMAFVHIGHDARIGNYVTIANQTAVSGHVIIEDGAVLSGYVLIHQFCRIGKLAMIGGRTILTQDVPPYCMLAENCRVCGPNVIGMRRAGLDSEARLAIRKAIKSYFFKDLNGSNALSEIENDGLTEETAHFVKFIRESERGIMAGESELAGFLFDEEL
ncbi:MAG: acyl-ACP--UDP-N-acetylglucosamine O-acyltransferase [Lentisphaerae bacterium]|nr:acyl-ACP--UDP-N-acetylglucosamine O-acyltransferase [Lentisphaerota bacterium]